MQQNKLFSFVSYFFYTYLNVFENSTGYGKHKYYVS